jgi:hypothetical protein
VKHSLKFALLGVLLVLHLYMLPAQHAENKPFDEDVWKELTEDMDYNEENAEQPTGFNGPNVNFDWSILKYVFFVAVLSVLIYLLVKYLINLQGTAANSEEIQLEVSTLEEAEENPMQANLDALIEKLRAEKDYRKATRAYFLLVLQRMYKSKLIEWKKPKTNFDYVHEVGDHSFHSSFDQLTRYFELIWYGKQAVGQVDFQLIEPQFKQLIHTIDQHAQ